MKENSFQRDVIKEVQDTFPGSVVLKNDSSFVQGIPDIIILFRDKWAALEFKRSKNATKQPNQEYYVFALNNMSYASFIYPENRQEVLDGLQRAFRAKR